MNGLMLALAFVMGVVVPLQAAINHQLKLLIGGSPVLAALVSFAVGLVTLSIAALLTGQKWVGLAALPRAEWWMLSGGALGRCSCSAPRCLPRLGWRYVAADHRRPGVRRCCSTVGWLACC
jgi:transporter family-2 protein